jgi:preprotein translocase subunit SecF
MGKSRLERRRQQRLEKQEVLKEKEKEKKRFFLSRVYDTHYKKIILIPFILLVVAVIIILLQYASTGSIINKGVSLKGGLVLTIETTQDIDPKSLENSLILEFPQADLSVKAYSELGKRQGLIIEASDIHTDNKQAENLLMGALESHIPNVREISSSRNVGSALGESFFRQTPLIVLIAFLFMGVVVFFYFKSIVPSAAVMLAALSDILITIAVTDVANIKLTTAGIAAFLMLIGYSVDTNILLSTRVIKRRGGTIYDRIISSMKTGVTMTLTTVCALIVALIFSQSEILTQIMTILLIGLIADLFTTWLQNAGILRWYLEKKAQKKAKAALAEQEDFEDEPEPESEVREEIETESSEDSEPKS